MISRYPSGKNFLTHLTTSQREALAGYVEPVFYPADTKIFTEGDMGDSCFFIDEGLVRLEVQQMSFEADVVLTYVEPGEVLGELSMLAEQPLRSLTAYAHRDTRCRVLTRTALSALCAANPEVGLAVMMSLGRQAANRLLEINIRNQGDSPTMVAHPDVQQQVERAQTAHKALLTARLSEPKIDSVLRDVAKEMFSEARSLAEEAVMETGLGNIEDKVHKNRLACEGILPLLEGRRAIGQISEDGDVIEYASPVGVVFAIVPVTNPVSNAIFKILLCIKTRNAAIMSFHRAGAMVGTRTVALARKVLGQHGLPEDLIQAVQGRTSRRYTQQFMRHPDVALILATGGPDMVKAAYSSGTPALGVGAGNAPAWICTDADPDEVARHILKSKTYDNGIICGSEHNLVVEHDMVHPLCSALERHGAAVLDEEEVERAVPALIDFEGFGLRRALLGKPGTALAQMAGIDRPYPIRLLVVPAPVSDLEGWLGREKLAPLLSLFTAHGDDDALWICERILSQQGAGHTAIVHTRNEERIRRFAEVIPTGRLLVNTPATHGMLGITTGLPLSFMLGCGTFGGNTTTDAINFRHLLNIKRLAPGRTGLDS